MSLFTKALNKIFKTGNQKELAKVKPLVDEINNQEPNFKNLRDGELKAKTHLLKDNLKNGRSLDSIIPESYALVREAAKRVLNERHYDAIDGRYFLTSRKNCGNENWGRKNISFYIACIPKRIK